MNRMFGLCVLWGCLAGSCLWGGTVQAEETFSVEAGDVASLRRTLSQVQELRDGGETSPATVVLPAGIYEFSEALELTPGLVGRGLKLRADKPGEVVFSGGVRLAASPNRENEQWRFRLPREASELSLPRVLLIQGRLRPAARYPNDGYLRIEASLPDRRSGFTVQPQDLPAGLDLTTGICDLVLLHDWSSSRLPVASFDGETRELKTIGPIGCDARHYAIDHFEKQPRYWLEGHPSFAELPGEWYFDQKTGEIVVLGIPGEPAPVVVLPLLEEVLIARGTAETPLRNLVLEGITFSASRFPMPPGGVAGAQATMHEPRDAEGKRTTRNRPMLTAAVRIDRSEKCRIVNCRFQGLGNSGLWLGEQTRDSLIQRCQFAEIGGNGINLGEDNSRQIQGKSWYQSAPEQVSRNNRIENCRLQFCGQVLPGAVGIWAPLNRELQIVNNHLHDLPYTGISLGWIWNPSDSPAGQNVIRENRIEFVMQVLSDGGGIYTLGKQPDSVIEQNVITDVPLNAGRAESNGVFLDEGTTGFTLQGNTFRRIDRSPLRFHKAGENRVADNTWELATPETPAVRFNNTPQDRIHIEENTVVEKQKRIFLIGNSLTWDTLPPRLDEGVHYHVDCGKPLPYIFAHPDSPCVATSRLWPVAFRTAQYDLISFQPHYGSTLDEDVMTISAWLALQPEAEIIIHTGWARHATHAEEFQQTELPETMQHSPAYFAELIKQLREKFPSRKFRTTDCYELLEQVQQDIIKGDAPFEKLEDLYRDTIHMNLGPGRYLMHNQMRQTLGQPRLETGFPEMPAEVKQYLDQLLDDAAAQP